jgi:hypothetical protein
MSVSPPPTLLPLLANITRNSAVASLWPPLHLFFHLTPSQSLNNSRQVRSRRPMPIRLRSRPRRSSTRAFQPRRVIRWLRSSSIRRLCSSLNRYRSRWIDHHARCTSCSVRVGDDERDHMFGRIFCDHSYLCEPGVYGEDIG